ncbi:MAG TPA: hypothetical protein VLA34_06355, partial [Candidatus Krumholzibacterium sp.]|nr:hypothetical protein [Candidatus Krumholzibacterium sp.]
MRINKTVPLLMLLFIIVSSGQGAGQAFRGDGDFEFFLDAGSLPQRGGRIIELFQIAVPTKEIEYKETDGSYRAAVSIYILLQSGGETVHERQLMISDVRDEPPAANDLTGFLYISDSCSVAPGSYELSVRVEDQNRKKKTLFGMLRKKNDLSSFEMAPLEVRHYPADELVLSEPFLLWGKQEDGRYIPNPMGIYGLKNDTISFFAHAMVPDGIPADRLEFFLTVEDDRGQTVDSVYTVHAVRDGQASIFGVFDVN